MAEIEIDGKKCSAEAGAMIIEVADREGIAIPRFCYHKKLSIAANCRMCLVEVEKSPKALPACATPIADGMKVFTKTEAARAAQHAVMEFLLINHPLDCPICDQGGECELQDVAMGYGYDESVYDQPKRVVKDENLGALVATEMTRCIHCTRCVRFGEEIAGVRELGLTHRGEHARIETYVEASLKSELSGNIIDLCPVGALTAKPSRFEARAWELQQRNTIAAHDCVGSNIALHNRREQVLRVVPRENQAVNETWISDRDRFSYLGIDSADRVTAPMIKRNGAWQTVTWPEAFDEALAGLQKVLNQHGAEQLGFLASPSATLEELYLLQKIARGVGCHNIDHRLQATDFSDQNNLSVCPGLTCQFEDLDKLDAFLLVGSNIYREQPIAGNRLRTAVRHGAKAHVINPIAYNIHFDLQVAIIPPHNDLVTPLLEVARAIANNLNYQASAEMNAWFKTVDISKQAQLIADNLTAGKNVGVFFGALAINHPDAAVLRSVMHVIMTMLSAKGGGLSAGANSQGAWIAGAIPHRSLTASGYATKLAGLDANQMLVKALKGYVLLNVEPTLDCQNPQAADVAMQQAQFVLSLSPFADAKTLAHAHVILPIGTWAETSGTFVNAAKTWQSFTGCVQAHGDSRPAWKVLRVLANHLQLGDFDYNCSTEVRDEVERLFKAHGSELRYQQTYPQPRKQTAELVRIGEWSMVNIDNVVRRAQALQASLAHEKLGVYMHPIVAAKYAVSAGQVVSVKQGNATVKLPVVIEPRIAEGCVAVATGVAETSELGPAFGAIEIRA